MGFPDFLVSLWHPLSFTVSHRNRRPIHRGAVQKAHPEDGPLPPAPDVVMLRHTANRQDLPRNPSDLWPSRRHPSRRAAVLVAHDHLLHHVHVLRISLQRSPPAVQNGQNTVYIHDLLGHHRTLHWFREKLHSAHHPSRPAGYV